MLLVSVACGDSGKSGNNPTATSTAITATAAPTTESLGTPSTDALLDDVIDLAVQLNTMTRDQAVCVFQTIRVSTKRFSRPAASIRRETLMRRNSSSSSRI